MTEPKTVDHALQLRRALLAIEKAEAKIEKLEGARREPIAIVGMGCRFPGGARTPEAFWSNLERGVDAISEVPASRWSLDELYDPDPSAIGKVSTRWGGFLDEVDAFDPLFFGIAPQEASSMDPQQRLALEVAWEALEHAGIVPAELAGGKTGVFMGACNIDYAFRLIPDRSVIGPYSGSGTALSVIANRISYLLNLRGPSFVVDTACSSSLVALHLACQSLRAGECDVALAGGVSLMLTPESTISFSKARMMAPDGRCKTFDARADGYVRGEGCGIVVLKRLSAALAAGDPVLSVIRGSAVNHDGTTSGLTAPNGISQQAVIRQALDHADLFASRIDFVETHGTGTSLGDPIEVEALASVLGEPDPKGRRCWLGAVKTNIGHLEGAAGVAGLIKTVLAMNRGVIPPNLHFQQLNPHISLDKTRLAIATEPVVWPSYGEARCAGISSFGFGGTNAHIVVEQVHAPAVAMAEPSRQQDSGIGVRRSLHVLPLAAKSASALLKQANRLAEHLDAHPEPSLDDICFTAGTGRSHFRHRLAVLADGRDALREELAAIAEGAPTTRTIQGPPLGAARPKVAFLFTGQGSQAAGMGRGLYESQPVFRRALDRCDTILRQHMKHPLLAVLYDPPHGPLTLDSSAYAQPALFALQIALTELWGSWGITPELVMGHSLGEYAAACVAGVFSLEDALALLAERGRLAEDRTPPGMVAAVRASEPEITARIARYRGAIAIAAANASDQFTLSGESGAVTELLAHMEAEGFKVRRIQMNRAFHSPLIDPMLDALEQAATRVTFAAPSLALFSNVTGERAGAEIATARYWRRHARERVRFHDGIRALHAKGASMFVEIGPHPILLPMVAAALSDAPVTLVPSLSTGKDDVQQMLAAVGRLYAHGATVQWAGLHADTLRRRVPLPTYPFERQRYWIETSARAPLPPPDRAGAHPLLGRRLPVAGRNDTVFEATLSLDDLPSLRDHRIEGRAVLPAAAYLEMAVAAAERFGPGAYLLEDLIFLEQLTLPESGGVRVQLVIGPESSERAPFDVYSLSPGAEGAEGTWCKHLSGLLRRVSPSEIDKPLRSVQRDDVEARCPSALAIEDAYAFFKERGVDYGPSFQCLARLHRGTGEAIALLERREPTSIDLGARGIPPALLDAGIQLFGVTWEAESPDDLYLPMGLGRFLCTSNEDTHLWVHARLRDIANADRELLVGDLDFFTESGDCVGRIEGLRLRRASRAALRGGRRPALEEWLYAVRWVPQPITGAEFSADKEAYTWLLLGEGGGLIDALGYALASPLGRCVLARSGGRFMQTGPDSFVLDPSDPEDMERLFEGLGGTPSAVVVLCERSVLPGEEGSPLEIQRRIAGVVLNAAQASLRSSGTRTPELWLVTRGAQTIAAEAPSLEQAPVWGLGRVLQVEHPELSCRLIDLDPSSGQTDLDGLVRELKRTQGEDQVAWRDGERYAARLAPYTPSKTTQSARIPAPPGEPRGVGTELGQGPAEPSSSTWMLVSSGRGVFEDLRLDPAPRRAPGPGEVEIKIHASGLNFRDVLTVLGLYPGDAGPLGGECAGVIRRVGDGVIGLAPGAEVIAIAQGAFRGYATTDARLVSLRPAALSAEEGATIPVAFLTAWYGLHRLAAISRGDRVLIHAAAGGVGMAAVEVARRAGAEVFATASPAKWPALRARGVEHIMSSRTLDFAGEILSATGGEGVDIVLNSLTGDFIPKSLSVLREGGRFLEIGKREILEEAEIARLKKGMTYHTLDLAEVARTDPESMQSMLAHVMDALRDGSLRSIPRQIFPIEEAAGAFRHMAQAKHVGKIVLIAPAEPTPAQPAPAQPSEPSPGALSALRSGGTHLITGGLGGLGLQVARWMAARGARDLVLLGRTPPSAAVRQAIEAIERDGVRVTVMQGDVSRSEDIARVLDAIQRALPPLSSVVHAAGILHDSALMKTSWEHVAEVMAPKVLGAWNLHIATREMPLRLFILFSSAASIVGLPGQSSYAAANAFLDALAHDRRAQGLPALSIHWGPWADVGMAASRRWTALGIGSIRPDDGLAALERVVHEDPGQIAVLPIQWTELLGRFAHHAEPPFLTALLANARARRHVERAVAPSAQRGAMLRELQQAAPGKRRSLLVEHVRREVAAVMGFDRSHPLDPRQGLMDLGMDSLMAVELRNRIQDGMGRPLPPTIAFDHPTIESLAALLARELFPSEPSAEPPPEPADPAAEHVPLSPEALSELSESQMAALLTASIESMDKEPLP